MSLLPRSAFLALLSVLAACQRGPTPPPAAVPVVNAPADATASRASAFTVGITLSPAARTRLSNPRESLIVSADYFGYPSAQALAQHVPGSENPWFTLHRAQVELESPSRGDTAIAHFPAVTLDAAKLAWTDAPDAPQVNVNIFSGRRSSPDNLLDCAMFQDTLAVAAKAPIQLRCGLIGESTTAQPGP